MFKCLFIRGEETSTGPKYSFGFTWIMELESDLSGWKREWSKHKVLKRINL